LEWRLAASLAERGLVGRFGYGALGARDISVWMEENWSPILGYVLEVFVLIKGWYCFLFKDGGDAELILQSKWVVRAGSLMLKRWHTTFNPIKEKICFRHLWVLLPGCPLVFWNVEAFRAIGDSLGNFMHVDLKMVAGSDRRMGKILVEMDMLDGLPAELEIDWCGVIYQSASRLSGGPLQMCYLQRDGSSPSSMPESFCGYIQGPGTGVAEPKAMWKTKTDVVWCDFVPTPPKECVIWTRVSSLF
jgi:hypothetical protein